VRLIRKNYYPLISQNRLKGDFLFYLNISVAEEEVLKKWIYRKRLW
jgi:hypothetical protein